MTHSHVRVRRSRVAGLLVAVAAIAAVVSHQSPASSSAPNAPAVDVFRGDRTPGVAGLDPDLVDALHRAGADAADDGVVISVTSGRRSPEHQARLLREAVSKYGSEAEAARWVAAPNRSAHVSGDAVDVGPSAAAAWLSEHGAAYGLCQIYGNEPWHYELRAEAADHGCPPMYADPTHDPRLQQ